MQVCAIPVKNTASPQPSQFDAIQEQLNTISHQLAPLTYLVEDVKIIKGEISGLKDSLEMAYSLINDSSDNLKKLESRI
jgi:archaellum component FlaC